MPKALATVLKKIMCLDQRLYPSWGLRIASVFTVFQGPCCGHASHVPDSLPSVLDFYLSIYLPTTYYLPTYLPTYLSTYTAADAYCVFCV